MPFKRPQLFFNTWFVLAQASLKSVSSYYLYEEWSFTLHQSKTKYKQLYHRAAAPWAPHGGKVQQCSQQWNLNYVQYVKSESQSFINGFVFRCVNTHMGPHAHTSQSVIPAHSASKKKEKRIWRHLTITLMRCRKSNIKPVLAIN